MLPCTPPRGNTHRDSLIHPSTHPSIQPADIQLYMTCRSIAVYPKPIDRSREQPIAIICKSPSHSRLQARTRRVWGCAFVFNAQVAVEQNNNACLDSVRVLSCDCDLPQHSRADSAKSAKHTYGLVGFLCDECHSQFVSCVRFWSASKR
jgi:hypothetical protein